MIEIYADYFYNNSLKQEHVYLDEAQISLVSEPILYDKLSKYQGDYVDVWKFSIVIGGAGQSFAYLDPTDCNTWYLHVKNSFLAHLGVTEIDS